jgi:acyl-CoA thioesterase-1
MAALLAAVSLAVIALAGGRSGGDATQRSATVSDLVTAADRDPSSGSERTSGSAVSAPGAVTRGTSASEGSSGPAGLGRGPVPRAHRHHSVVLAQVEPAAVSRLGAGAKAVFLGDSYTSGWNGAGIGSHSWPALVGADRGWKVVNLSVAGTGFMNPGWTAQPIASQVDAAVRQRPQVVFVAGGHNDSRWPAATTSKAALTVIDRLHAALPGAVIVIIAPIWQDGSPPSRCLALRDALRRKAAAIGAVFVDPLGEHWFAGASHRFIGPDGLHPTNAGHAWLASRVLAELTGI